MSDLTIYKYPLRIGVTELNLPLDAEVLTVQTQNNEPMLWAIVDPDDSETEKRVFYMLGTGHRHPSSEFTDLEFIATIQLSNGELVFHVFERVIPTTAIDGTN